MLSGGFERLIREKAAMNRKTSRDLDLGGVFLCINARPSFADGQARRGCAVPRDGRTTKRFRLTNSAQLHEKPRPTLQLVLSAPFLPPRDTELRMPIKDRHALGPFTKRVENGIMAFGRLPHGDRPSGKEPLNGAVIRSFHFFGRFLTRAFPRCAILKKKAAPRAPLFQSALQRPKILRRNGRHRSGALFALKYTLLQGGYRHDP